MSALVSGLWMALLSVLAAIWLTRPLWRSHLGADLRRRSLNVVGYQQRLDEIDADVESGTLDERSAQQLRDETAARLLQDTDQRDAAAATAVEPRSRLWWLSPLLLAALIGAVGGFGYFLSDAHKLSRWIAQAAADPQAGRQLFVADMVQRLEQRLQADDEDAEGWAMLGRSYSVLERYPEAAAAYARANLLTAETPSADWLADEGELRLFASGGDSRGLPVQLFARALDADPQQSKALWYAGLTAAREERFDAAMEYWLKLRGQELPEDFRSLLEQHLAEVARLGGRELPEQPTSPAGVRLTVDVDVDPELVGDLPNSATLFVLARRPEGGPPLAVVRQPFSGATQVVLDDSQAMIAGNTLSSAERWLLIARISLSGTAQAQSGDFEGRLEIGRDQAQQLQRLTIDRRVP